MKFFARLLCVTPLLAAGFVPLSAAERSRWTEAKATDWYQQQPWLVGANYIPSTAINQLEMWQAETFDPQRIDLELGWAQELGMNTMRVFLHDLLWEQDAAGFKKRIDTFLTIAQKHGMRPIFVLFDSCWDPFPALGKQRAPRPGIHNSGWVQSPGAKALMDPDQQDRLKAYVEGVIGAFASDDRVLAWDLWNEPDNPNFGSYGLLEPKGTEVAVTRMLPLVYRWAREANPSQPLTSGLWQGEWSRKYLMNDVQRTQVQESDIFSFHSYSSGEKFEQRVKALEQFGQRPILCTEYMARSVQSTFQGTLPVALKYRVAAINWGLVAGKTQTYLPWDSWRSPYINREPAVWFHEIFHNDGTPYSAVEVKFIQAMTAQGRQQWPANQPSAAVPTAK